MRIRHAKLIVAFTVITNLVLVYYCWKFAFWRNITAKLAINSIEPQYLNGIYNGNAQESKDKIKNKHIRKCITIIFREFYAFENDLKASIDSILNVIPSIQILVLQNGMPYPPLVYENNHTMEEESSVRFINVAFDIQKMPNELNPLAYMHTKYALFMPDSVRLTNKSILQKILREVGSQGKTTVVQKDRKQNALPAAVTTDKMKSIIIVPFASNTKSLSSCTHIKLDFPNWTIQYSATNISENCDLYLQKHAVLVDVDILKEMPDPFAAPFPQMFYIQAKIAKISKSISSHMFQDGRRLFSSYHNKQRRIEERRREFKEMYKKLQIKRIVRRSHRITTKNDPKENSIHSSQHNIAIDMNFSSSNLSLPQVTEIDLIGCERTTKSCIGPVHNNHPFYIYLGKHTPPCCLDKLKTTFNHVLEEFENVGIRYWLDNFSLKTAVETNKLDDDAYEIDLSFNVNDLERSNAMKKSQNKPYVDNEGFYWIKATDGYYFRVQFSKINRIGVNLLPFEIKGTEVRPNGFFGWKAKEFSADYLHPMSMVLFLGKNVMCPNNVREFLDSKNI